MYFLNPMLFSFRKRKKIKGMSVNTATCRIAEINSLSS
jgi:hypothetical protein